MKKYFLMGLLTLFLVGNVGFAEDQPGSAPAGNAGASAGTPPINEAPAAAEAPKSAAPAPKKSRRAKKGKHHKKKKHKHRKSKTPTDTIPN